jgi:cell division protein FtsZ
VEAAQEAISSPLLDNISIQGAAGVLINITGGMDLAIDEVTTISSIIQEAAGDDAEIIFGAVHDSSMEGAVRVTVIATGFDKADAILERVDNVIRPNFAAKRPEPRSGSKPAIPAPSPTPILRESDIRPIERKLPSDLEIPTFIRRQMD